MLIPTRVTVVNKRLIRGRVLDVDLSSPDHILISCEGINSGPSDTHNSAAVIGDLIFRLPVSEGSKIDVGNDLLVEVHVVDPNAPRCFECGSGTVKSGQVFRCINCGSHSGAS